MKKKTLIKNPTSKTDTWSARFRTKIGDRFKKKGKTYELIDKAVYKIDYCPYCSSSNTFHKRMMAYNHNTNFNIGNVWNVETIKDNTKYIFIKKDFCYECQSEYIIEFYVYRIYPRFVEIYGKITNYLDKKFKIKR